MYEKFKTIKTEEEYFKLWKQDEVAKLTKGLQHEIYNRYFVKCVVFQRDNFNCQNEGCTTPESKLTLHHIRFQKNDGKYSLRNCVTICKSCHSRFHKGATELTFWGATYRIHKEVEVNWKQMKKKMRDVRRNNKDQHGVMISMELLRMLMRFLDIDVNSMHDDEEDDD